MSRGPIPYGYTIGLQKVDFSAPLGAPVVYDLAQPVPPRARSIPPRPLAGQKADRLLHRPRRARAGSNCASRTASAGGLRRSTAAGCRECLQVSSILPEGADPLDIRYNVVNWVDRATRGWSYGQPIADPRTGEIIKGSGAARLAAGRGRI